MPTICPSAICVVAEVGHQFHVGGLQLAGQGADPALVGDEVVALHRE
jgi:hypothetical protein